MKLGGSYTQTRIHNLLVTISWRWEIKLFSSQVQILQYSFSWNIPGKQSKYPRCIIRLYGKTFFPSQNRYTHLPNYIADEVSLHIFFPFSYIVTLAEMHSTFSRAIPRYNVEFRPSRHRSRTVLGSSVSCWQRSSWWWWWWRCRSCKFS